MGKLKDAMLGEEQERDVDAEYESWRDQQMFDEIEIHKKFSESRLRSYYIANPRLMCPAITMLREAKGLLADKHYSACVVFQALLAKALALSAWRAGTQGRLAYRRGRGFFHIGLSFAPPFAPTSADPHIAAAGGTESQRRQWPSSSHCRPCH